MKRLELVLAISCLLLAILGAVLMGQNQSLRDRMLDLLYQHDQAHHHPEDVVPCE